MQLRPTKLSVKGKRVWLEDDEDGAIRANLEYGVLEAARPALLIKMDLTDEQDECVIVEG